ncbi:DUF2911 domain-containing protein [Muricauda sp. 2012CJ35-5]|uniref:DUF2911 domain-containing protein n=1 Tax=Flagellimonas spongiicola TaxID=2942208 RepID=A0ABT0PW62_9FLAO|nr:DUF2911 domain-containing protein [Allomuricauda spongiicola]MCL6275627.1 DUF2911 domain-containing protein [Allomuricauda spongiicola]
MGNLGKQLIGFMVVLAVSSVNAQITHPKASPFTTISQDIGLSNITIKYSRPAAKGRHIFGGLVPYGRIWRVGANESTKLSVDTDVMVKGNLLPKGTYALYAFPEESIWKIAFHKNTGHWGDGRKNYKPEEDLFRIEVSPKKIAYHQENFLITLDAITHDSAQLKLIWGDTMVEIPLQVDTNAQMEKEIELQLKENPTAQTYYEAARYLQEQATDYERALGYLNMALELGGDTYYFHRVKSLVEAALGNYEAAIASAKKSLEIAEDLEKDEFVRMNAKNIEKWEANVVKQ